MAIRPQTVRNARPIASTRSIRAAGRRSEPYFRRKRDDTSPVAALAVMQGTAEPNTGRGRHSSVWCGSADARRGIEGHGGGIELLAEVIYLPLAVLLDAGLVRLLAGGLPRLGGRPHRLAVGWPALPGAARHPPIPLPV